MTQIGLLFGGLIAGAVVVEAIFDWPGIGSYTVQAILTADCKVMLAVTLLVGVIYAIVNILVDVVHGLLDPRAAGAAGERADPPKVPARRARGARVSSSCCSSCCWRSSARWLAPIRRTPRRRTCCSRLKPPSADYPFGTDNLGRDIFSRVMLGARGALAVALAVVGVAMLIGVPLGLIAGYRGGWLQRGHHARHRRVPGGAAAHPGARARAADVAVARKRDAGAGADLLAVLHPHRLCRDAARSQPLFVDALRGIGAGTRAHLFLHILPNVASPVIVRATIGMGFTILVAAVLGFLGMGATPPAPDWGLAIAESRTYLPRRLVVSPPSRASPS